MPLNIIVCIKSTALRPPDRSGKIPPEAYALNPFDRPALEAALRLQEADGGRITALSMGPPFAETVLREALAMGVDQAVLLCDPALAGSDTLATTTALAAAIQRLAPYDLLLFGTRAADGDTGHVGPQTATVLDLPLVTGACEITRQGEALTITRRADGLTEQFRMGLPGALTIHPQAMTARDLPLSGIETGYTTGSVTIETLADLGLAPDQVGETGSPTRVRATRPVQREKQCAFITGTAAEQADRLVERLVANGLIDG